ncbi:MAG: 50S ribosomal protein L11 methyltransferase [Muribaculaceae bacterium]|nr:50S ribosomal protein L11 methyltransferase [Muribaculaceae bacterium]
MNDYREVRITPTPCNETVTDILADALCGIGYESFVPDNEGVTAYIKNEDFSQENLSDVLTFFPLPDVTFTFTETMVEGRDWNREWEKNYFQPIVVDNRCVIHSSFHHDFPQCEYDIVIDPKMAFGTGHHSTTSLIIRQLLSRDLNGKAVTDMGTGTGILAILAAMRGASPVTAIEIDPMAQVNAVENVALNHHPEINVLLGDASLLADAPKADLFLANINRNIIMGDLSRYAEAMKPGATLLLSGFYTEDVDVIMPLAESLGFTKQGVTSDNNWACLELRLS